MRAKTTSARRSLHLAASRNSVETAKLLIAYHADLNARGYLDHTPLIDAGREGNREMEALLRQHGAIDRWRS
jgi:ankyrin repeat protein